MNFTNCHVTIHAVNNYATVTVSDPSNNTTFDISASNAYSPYYTYQPAYGYNNGSNVYCYPVYNSFGPTGPSGACASGPSGVTGSSHSRGPSGATGTTRISDFPRSIYSYYN